MSERRRDDGEALVDDATSPWATDIIPVDDGPTEFEWAIERPATTDEPKSQPLRGRRRGTVGAIAVIAIAIGGVLVWLLRSDDRNAATSPSDTSPTTLATLPDLVGVPPAVERSTTSATTLELPDPLAAIQEDMELVALVRNELLTISLPAGTMVGVAAGDGIGNDLIVSPSATAIFGAPDIKIVPHDDSQQIMLHPDETREFGTQAHTWLTNADGDDAFLMSYLDPGGGIAGFRLLANDGSTEPLQAGVELGPLFPFVRQQIGGDLLLNDAGGAYVLPLDGSPLRVTGGRTLAATSTHLVIRECDEILACRTVVRELATGDERELDSSIVDLVTPSAVDLSPDGTAAVVINSSGERQLIDFQRGVINSSPARPFSSGEPMWAPDSSGFFELDESGDIAFIERASGESFTVARQLGRVADFGVRPPVSEPEPST